MSVVSPTAEEPFVFGNLLNKPVINSTQPSTDYYQAFSKRVMGNLSKAVLPTRPAYGGGCKDILQLGNHTAPAVYSFGRFRFLRSFRQNAVLPLSWRRLNVSETRPTGPT